MLRVHGSASVGGVFVGMSLERLARLLQLGSMDSTCGGGGGGGGEIVQDVGVKG